MPGYGVIPPAKKVVKKPNKSLKPKNKNNTKKNTKKKVVKNMKGGAGCATSYKVNQKGAAHCHGDHKKMNMKGGAGCGMRNNQKGAAHCHGDHKKMNMKGGFIRDHSPMRSVSGKRTCNN
jgi:hypothetical protein